MYLNARCGCSLPLYPDADFVSEMLQCHSTTRAGRHARDRTQVDLEQMYIKFTESSLNTLVGLISMQEKISRRKRRRRKIDRNKKKKCNFFRYLEKKKNSLSVRETFNKVFFYFFHSKEFFFLSFFRMWEKRFCVHLCRFSPRIFHLL